MAVPPLLAVEGRSRHYRRWIRSFADAVGPTRIGQAHTSRGITCVPSRFGVTVNEQLAVLAGPSFYPIEPSALTRSADTTPKNATVWSAEESRSSSRVRYFGGRSACRISSGQPLTPPLFHPSQAASTANPQPGHRSLCLEWFRIAAMMSGLLDSGGSYSSDFKLGLTVGGIENGPFNFQPLQTLVLGPEEKYAVRSPYDVVHAQTKSLYDQEFWLGLENNNGNEYPSINEPRAKRAEARRRLRNGKLLSAQ